MQRVKRISLFLALVTSLLSCRSERWALEGLTFCPDGKRVAAVYSHTGSSFIYTVDIETGKATRLSKAAGGFEGVPSFSADGKRIAYAYKSTADGIPGIIIANADGTSPHILPNSEINDSRPLFLPDSRTLLLARSAFYGNYSPIARPARHGWNFFITDLDGKEMRQLTTDRFYLVSRASISPDGKTLLFVSSEEHGDSILLCSLQEPPTPRRVLMPHVPGKGGDAVIADALFLPDGRSMLFTAATDGAHGAYDYDVYRMDLGTEKFEKLTTANGYSYGLQVSPDGKTAVFSRDTPHWYGTKTEILLLDLATQKPSPLKVTGLR